MQPDLSTLPAEDSGGKGVGCQFKASSQDSLTYRVSQSSSYMYFSVSINTYFLFFARQVDRRGCRCGVVTSLVHVITSTSYKYFNSTRVLSASKSVAMAACAAQVEDQSYRPCSRMRLAFERRVQIASFLDNVLLNNQGAKYLWHSLASHAGCSRTREKPS